MTTCIDLTKAPYISARSAASPEPLLTMAELAARIAKRRRAKGLIRGWVARLLGRR